MMATEFSSPAKLPHNLARRGDHRRGYIEALQRERELLKVNAAQKSAPVNAMRAHVERSHPCTVNAEDHPQIAFDHHAVNRVFGACGKRVDFMRAERRMERIGFEDAPCLPHGFLLRGIEPVE